MARNLSPTLETSETFCLNIEMLREAMPRWQPWPHEATAGQFTRGLQGGALFRTAVYHSHSVAEILGRIFEYFEAIAAGRPYFGEAQRQRSSKRRSGSCEAAAVVS